MVAQTEKFAGRGLVSFNILSENASSGAPSTSDLKAWTDSYGFGADTYAVGDPDSTIFNKLYPGDGGYMGSMVLTRATKITFIGVGTASDDDIEDALTD